MIAAFMVLGAFFLRVFNRYFSAISTPAGREAGEPPR